MNMCNISEDAFKNQIREIRDISEKLKDNWELCSVQNCLYLKKKEIVLVDLNEQNTICDKDTEELETRDASEDAINSEEVDSACLAEEVPQRKVCFSFVNK